MRPVRLARRDDFPISIPLLENLEAPHILIIWLAPAAAIDERKISQLIGF